MQIGEDRFGIESQCGEIDVLANAVADPRIEGIAPEQIIARIRIGTNTQAASDRAQPLDPELRTLLSTLVTGQIQLAESQAHLDARFSEGHAQLAEGHLELVETCREIKQTLVRMEARIDRMGNRLDATTKAIVEGFTSGASVDRHLEDDVRSLEGRVTALERRSPQGGSSNEPPAPK